MKSMFKKMIFHVKYIFTQRGKKKKLERSPTCESRYIIKWGFPDGSVVKNPPANAGDVGSITGQGRSPGEGNGNP